jgi:hypothetical protein
MKKIKLPKDALVEPEQKDAPFIDEADVEGHGLPTTAPPGIGAQFPGHGGEATPTKDKDDDVKGHRRK